MSIKFKSKLSELDVDGKIVQSKHRTIRHTDAVQTLEVKVITKTAAHPSHGSGSSYGYTIDGVEGAYLELTPGITYKFDQSDNSNGGTGTGGAAHPLLFATAADAAGSTQYTTGVTTSGSPGSSGAYTQIIPTTTTPPILHYYCSSHTGMGSYAKFGTGTVGDTYSINVATDGSNVDLNLDAASGTDSTVQLTAGSNITLTRNDAQQVTIAASGGALTVQEEGSSLSTAATTLNFTGSAVTASGTGATKTINIPGGSGVTVQEEGSSLSTAGTTLNFVGSGVTASGTGATKTITVSGGGGSSGQVTTQLNVSGDGTTQATDGSRTAFTISSAPASENNLQIYLDGVYQAKSDFSVSGTTVTLDAAPATGTVLEIIHFTVIDANIFLQSHTTANNSTTSFSAGGVIANENDTQVYIDGVYQSKSNYSVSGSNVVLSTAPATGAVVEIVNIKASATSSGSITWETGIKTSSFTAAAGKGYFVNTTSGAVTVSLPAGSAGEEIHFTDYASTFDTNSLILDANGSQKIQGGTANKQCTTENATVRLIYQDDTKGWTADNILIPPVTVNYLVVAGGGGASVNRGTGGGGAGGLRTSYGSASGGGGSAESALSLAAATNYTVTVGGGGAAAASNAAAGGNGSNSVFSTITSTGGGGGPSGSSTGGNNGGSGSGGGSVSSTKHAPGSGTANQGYAGGVYTAPGGNDEGGGGGGGAGAVGSAGTTIGGNAYGGAGGVGLAVNILNTTNAGTASVGEVNGGSVFFAGGGGGGFMDYGQTIPSNRGGDGGTGGGGNGGGGPSSITFAAAAGTVNTGGAAGGAGANVSTGSKAGGSGVVILRYPSSFTLTAGAGLTQSSGSPFTEGSDKISVFTAGTGTITFS